MRIPVLIGNLRLLAESDFTVPDSGVFRNSLDEVHMTSLEPDDEDTRDEDAGIHSGRNCKTE